MMADTLYLEIAKDSGAILSYSDKQLQSSTSDYIEATEAELNYLNAMEAKLPAGMVTTLADLHDYRAKVKAVAQAQAKVAQSKGKVARLTIESAKIKAELAAIQAKKDALLKAGAARHGVTVAEYEAEMIAQYKASQAGTDAPLYKSGRTREETARLLQQAHRDSKRKNYR